MSGSYDRPRALDDDAVIAKVSEAARLVAAADSDAGPKPEAWRRLQTARARAPRGFGRRRTRSLVGVFTGLALLIGALTQRRNHPLTYTVRGAPPEDDGYIHAVGEAGTDLQFSDGTRVHLKRGTRMSVVSPGSRGARLRLEDGEGRFEVTHLPGADWTVEAGPFRIHVTGTVFDVRWSGADESVEVRLRSGSVRVSGPLLSDPITLRAGQRLASVLASRQLRIDDIHDDVGPVPTLAAAATDREDMGPAVPLDVSSKAEQLRNSELESRHKAHLASSARSKAGVPAAESTAADRSSWDPETWASRMAADDSASVVSEAKRRGVDRAFAEVDVTALAALADAARYTGDRELAGRALQQERRRFPDTAQAKAAAFLLGRMAEDLGDAVSGLAWYRSYLTEAPHGPYAAEALGREMLTVEHLFGRVAASAIAREYLRRFPGGTYLLQARSVLDSP
jgi:hypothetical protein